MKVLNKYQVVDLTHPLHPDIPTWSGGCGFQLSVKLDYPQGLRVQSLKSHAGIGTHLDAPSHFIKGSRDIAEIPLEELITPLYVLDLSRRMNPDLFISEKDLLDFEEAHGRILKNSAFFAFTGWSQFWNEPLKYRNLDAHGQMHFPGFSLEAAQLLLKREITCLGIDTLSPDGSNHTHFPVHLAILGANKAIIENLANLDQIPPLGSFVIALPPRSSMATESTARVIALIDS